MFQWAIRRLYSCSAFNDSWDPYLNFWFEFRSDLWLSNVVFLNSGYAGIHSSNIFVHLSPYIMATCRAQFHVTVLICTIITDPWFFASGLHSYMVLQTVRLLHPSMCDFDTHFWLFMDIRISRPMYSYLSTSSISVSSMFIDSLKTKFVLVSSLVLEEFIYKPKLDHVVANSCISCIAFSTSSVVMTLMTTSSPIGRWLSFLP